MSELSIYERMDKLHGEISQLVEDMGATVYRSIEDEALKRVAIAAGVDWTVEGTVVIEAIGDALQHERDVNRELRRALRGARPAPPLPDEPWGTAECEVCAVDFTPLEWDERHDCDGGVCHADCCPDCNTNGVT